jgi:DNA-binding transcriptional regulator LsrR (DeoR family)
VEHLSGKVGQRLQWRRDKVREYSIKGYTQRDIAAELQVPLTDVNRDLKYLREQSKHNIERYIDEYLPAEFQHCLEALSMIVKEMWNLKTEDNRELMQNAD